MKQMKEKLLHDLGSGCQRLPRFSTFCSDLTYNIASYGNRFSYVWGVGFCYFKKVDLEGNSPNSNMS